MTRPVTSRRPVVVSLLAALGLGIATIAPVVAAPSTEARPDVISVTKGATVDATRPPGDGQDAAPGDAGGRVDTAVEFKRTKRLGSNPLRSEPAVGDRVTPLAPGDGTTTSPGRRAKSNPNLLLAYEGLNHRDSRLVDDGNAYSGEPADQGLCVGNGYALETVNSALQIFDARTGAAVSDPVSLNTFYGFPVAIDRTADPVTFPGPFAFDISCHYDPGSNRWFHLMVDLEQNPVTGEFTGRNYLDLAVSTSGDPTGSWVVYRIPGMNDGTEGTPDHDCNGPCFADFPHIGVDRNGVYITTNEFPLFADGFNGAQVYALSKQALVSGAATVDALLYDTSQAPWQVAEDEPGFTVWPALSAGSQFDGAQGGTQYFVSSRAVFDDTNGDADSIITWALSNTSTLASGGFPTLTRTVVPSLRYAVPPPSPQKDGVAPLRDCLNDTEQSVFGVNCGELLGLPPLNEVTGPIDTSDSRVLDVRYANGNLWAVLGTAAEVAGEQRAGVGWFVLNPSVSASGVRASMRSQGILALQGENLAYPTIGVTASGRGVMGFTAVGENRHPSYAYASLDAVVGVSAVRTMLEGEGVQDGFTEYPPIGGNRPRWGDYGAAAVDGRTVYLAGQYIAAPGCSLEDFVVTDCGDTRTLFANWSTAVGALRP